MCAKMGKCVKLGLVRYLLLNQEVSKLKNTKLVVADQLVNSQLVVIPSVILNLPIS